MHNGKAAPMPGLRTLWTGPCGVDLRTSAIARAAREPSSLWLVPSPLCRDQVSRALAMATKGAASNHRVWCWDDVWKATAAGHADPPARLSAAGLRAVLAEAIERARAGGDLASIGPALGFPGYRRQVLDRFAGWTRDERPVEAAPPDDSPAGRDEWALFGFYRATLADLRSKDSHHRAGAQDPDGWAAWASRELIRKPPPELRKTGL